MMASRSHERGSRWKEFLIRNNMFIIFVALIVFSAFLSDNFLSIINLRNLLIQQTAPVLVALGMLFVILAGGIDLSVGSMMAVGSAVSASLIADFGMHFSLSVTVTLVVGLVFGLLAGVLVAYFGVQGFVATLATMTIARGVAFVITDGTPVAVETGTLDTLASSESGYRIIGVRVIIIFAALFVHRFTGYGSKAIAIGSNETALRLAGVRTKRIVMSTYAISGVLATLAGAFLAARSS